MKQEKVLIGDNSASLTMTVEVENGILSVNNRFEFVTLEGKKGGFDMNPLVERISLLIKDYSENAIKDVRRFLSVGNYQSSETEYQTARLLYEGYAGFCKEHHFEQISKITFLTQLESLGFKVRRRMTNNETFVYCKKEE